MAEINENDAANLSTLIYGRNLPEIGELLEVE